MVPLQYVMPSVAVSNQWLTAVRERTRLKRVNLALQPRHTPELESGCHEAHAPLVPSVDAAAVEGEDDDDEEDDDEGNEFGVDDGCMFDVEAFDIDEPWCVFNVMLIATNEGVSRRIGLGKMHVAAFTEDHGARWRDIVLA